MENIKKDSKNKFNIFDLIIVIVLILCLALAIFKFFFANSESLNDEVATVEFVVNGISDFNASCIITGRKLYLNNDGSLIGQIESASTTPSKLSGVDKVGNIIYSDYPNHSDVHGKATIYGKWSDKGFMLNGKTLISLGTEISVYTEINTFSLTIVGVSQQ